MKPVYRTTPADDDAWFRTFNAALTGLLASGDDLSLAMADAARVAFLAFEYFPASYKGPGS